jgi:hypothetical protein
MSISLLLAVGSIGAVTYVGMRDHRAAKAARLGVLDRCAGALDAAVLTHGADHFPRLTGRHRGCEARVDLLCDTLTIRRLPQLWMSTTLLDQNPDLPGFAILVRPAGTEFYSLTSRFEHRLETPMGFPEEVLIRGDAGADRPLEELRTLLSDVLTDPRVKEVAVTPRGVRIIRQAAEGKRGNHLLLRQSVFENACVPQGDLTRVLDDLQSIRAAIGARTKARAA